MDGRFRQEPLLYRCHERHDRRAHSLSVDPCGSPGLDRVPGPRPLAERCVPGRSGAADVRIEHVSGRGAGLHEPGFLRRVRDPGGSRSRNRKGSDLCAPLPAERNALHAFLGRIHGRTGARGAGRGRGHAGDPDDHLRRRARRGESRRCAGKSRALTGPGSSTSGRALDVPATTPSTRECTGSGTTWPLWNL